MKKLFTLLLSFTALTASAQITLEKEYAAGTLRLDVIKLSTGAVKYVTAEDKSPTVRLYNLDHSLFRQVTLPTALIGTDFYVETIADKLFNQDAALEFGVSVRNATDTNSAYKIISESGSLIASIDSVAGVEFYNTPAGAKMLAARNFNLKRANEGVRVYNLPGTYTTLKATNKLDELTASPYPNPAAESIRLPYSVKKGEVATLDVLSMTGQVVKSYKVDATFDHLQLKARELPAGTYVYRVTSATGATAGKKFVVTR
ncbi:T9SS type A sorting domain-containing protein [Hymenobacter metallicola]|uniref:T9SS type A sorting domain-containing protein n=1 Tax=Hymenobacter metallicola TaxID=2563114 RepID=A0A4Z0Q226_9BACT|nr:T9SS type A sorting domain-containing protein [Hymenobacter metallicola]TGE23566.1 T9SS type A sorting domain-containing protein [Hymenobacter metallicola]